MVALCIFCAISCTDDSDGNSVTTTIQDVQSITLNKTSAQVAAGGTLTLTATVLPNDATNKTVSWEVSPESLATLSAKTGNIVTLTIKTGATAGSAVRVKAKAGEKEATCTITVKTATTPPTPEPSPSDITSGNEDIIKTEKEDDGEVKITTGTDGKSTITINYDDGTKTATFEVEMKDGAVSMDVTDAAKFIDVSTLASSNDAVLRIENNGTKLTATPGTGSTTVTAKTKGAANATTYDVTVENADSGGGKVVTIKKHVDATVAVASIALSKSNEEVAAGGNLTLTATVNPSNATNKTVTWEVSPAGAATLSATTGNTVTVSVGSSATVGSQFTIKAKAGGKEATCTVTIKASGTPPTPPPVEGAPNPPAINWDGPFDAANCKVKITCSTSDADIYYTTDGSTPDATKTKYTEAFAISDTTTVKAIAIKDGKNSESQTKTFNFWNITFDAANAAGATPSTVIPAQKVRDGGNGMRPDTDPTKTGFNFINWYEVTDATAGTLSGEIFDFTKKVTKNISLKAKYLELNYVADPVIAWVGDYGANVAITCATEGADIYYTTDGSTPDPTKPTQKYTGEITLTADTTTVKAVAVKTGMNNSQTVPKECKIFTVVIAEKVTNATTNKTTYPALAGADFAAQKVHEGGKVRKPASDPTKTGYNFLRWTQVYSTEDGDFGDDAFNFDSTTVTSGICKEGTQSFKVAAIWKKIIKVKTLTISQSAANVQQGKTLTLTAELSPHGADNKTINWTVTAGGSLDTAQTTVYNPTVVLTVGDATAHNTTITIRAETVDKTEDIKNADGTTTPGTTLVATCAVTAKDPNVFDVTPGDENTASDVPSVLPAGGSYKFIGALTAGKFIDVLSKIPSNKTDDPVALDFSACTGTFTLADGTESSPVWPIKAPPSGGSPYDSYRRVREIILPNGLDRIPAYFANQGDYSSSNETLTKVVLGSGITEIGDFAFYHSREIDTVDFSACANLRKIGIRAFTRAKISNIDLSACSHLETIDHEAFASPSILTVSLPASLKTLGCSYYYYDKNTGMGKGMNGSLFIDECSGLTSITVAVGNQYFESADGVLFNKGKTTLLVYPRSKAGASYTVPATVTTIADYAVSWSRNLTSVTLSANLEEIGKNAFEHFKGQSIDIGNCSHLKRIGEKAFYESNITLVKFPASLESTDTETEKTVDEGNGEKIEKGVGWMAFSCYEDSNLTYLDISAVNVENIYFCTASSSSGYDYTKGSFYNVFKLPKYSRSNITKIKLSAGSFTSDINSGGNISYGGNDLFSFKKLTEFEVAASDTKYSVVDGVLFNKNKTELLIYPPAKTDATYTVPYGVTKIKRHAFIKADNIETLILPSSLTEIERETFRSLGKLAHFDAHTTQLATWFMETSQTTGDIYSGLEKECELVGGLPATVTTIKKFGYFNNAVIDIPATVTTVGGYNISPFGNLQNTQEVRVHWTGGKAPSGWDSDWKEGCKATIYDYGQSPAKKIWENGAAVP